MPSQSKIDTPEEVMNLISLEIGALGRELDQYPFIKDYVDLSVVAKNLNVELTHQASKGGYDIKSVYPSKDRRDYKVANHTSEQFEVLSEDNPNQMDDKKKELLQFKSFYMTWARNLIAELNKIKMQNQWRWFDVKPMAKVLANLSLDSKNNNESVNVLFTNESEELLERNWDKVVHER